jgi:phospholipid/cholesterol/gamma-HCH transport system permease protein
MAIVVAFLEWFGEFGRFCARLCRTVWTRPFEREEFARQLDEIGARSLLLVSLAGAATGIVFSLEARDSLLRFGAKPLLPTIVVLSLLKESGPIITGLIVSGRVGASIGAELAAMKATEQLDAMEVSAVDPFRYLVTTRVLACILMLPLLTLAADFSGVLMGWLSATLSEPISLRLFIDSGFARVGFNDLLPATLKTAVFGLIIGLVACFEGLRARSGTAGVERAAASSVVFSSIFIILADVVLVRMILVFFP